MRKPPVPLNQLDWNLMRVFHAIVQHGGVSAAARALGKQQPATSQGLARLEDQFGAKLCERGPGGFELTAEGKIVFEIARNMVALMQEAPDLLTQAVGDVRGDLRIGIMSNVHAIEFDEILSTIVRRHPMLNVGLEVAPWRSIVSLVRSGDIDLGVGYDRELSPDLTYFPIFSEVQQLYCSAMHRLYGFSFQNPGDLAQESFFLTGRDEPLELTNYRRQFRLGKYSRGGSEDLEELKRLVMTGGGIGFLPTRNVVDEVAEKKLWPLLLSADLPTYPVFLIIRDAPDQTLAARLFVLEARRVSAGSNTQFGMNAPQLIDF